MNTDTINDLQLRDESVYPDENILRDALGNSYEVYDKLLRIFNRNDMVHEWRYYKDGKAWLCKVQKKKKTIVWMSAWKGFMMATIYFPLRFLDQILELDIKDSTRDAIKETKNVGKSKPCTFKIQGDDILNDFESVMKFKLVAK